MSRATSAGNMNQVPQNRWAWREQHLSGRAGLDHSPPSRGRPAGRLVHQHPVPARRARSPAAGREPVTLAVKDVGTSMALVALALARESVSIPSAPYFLVTNMLSSCLQLG